MRPMTIHVQAAIASVENSLREANNYFMCASYGGDAATDDDDAIASYYIERAFIELLVLVEHLSLTSTYQMISKLYEQARLEGFTKSTMGPEEPYLIWGERVRMFVDGISG